jgi:heme-degrading monooxygenase HmoA
MRLRTELRRVVVYYSVSIHHPAPGKRDALIASMHRYGAAITGAPGLVSVNTLHDAEQDVLMGLAIWESEAAFQTSVHLAREAVADDPFDEWEGEPVVGFRLTEA